MVFLLSGITLLSSHVSAQNAKVEFAPAKSGVIESEVLVGVRADQDDAQAGARLGAIGATAVSHQANLHVYRLRLHAGMTAATAMSRLRQRGEVLYAEPNHIYHVSSTPNDTYYASQYGPQKTQADLAWGIWKPTTPVILAIVDTGIDDAHPDLTNKIYRSGGAVVGYNAVTGVANTATNDVTVDDFGHGTHCAGIAAAQINNGTGIAGIAGWNGNAAQTDTTYTKLMPVKVLDSTGNGTDLTVADGITWAADHGAKIISMSLGGSDSSTTLNNAVQYAWGKGCVIVAAAGNSGTSAFSYPAAYSNVISVAATDSNDQLAYFSNFGSWVLVAAPGYNILSTLPTYTTNGGYGTNYNYLSGTSMATPHVAGEAALILAQNSSLTNAQVVSLILNNVDPYTPYTAGNTIATNAGRINIYRALQAAGGTVQAPAAPTNLTASPGNTQIGLSWSASSGATSYNVKRSLVSGGPYTTIAANLATTTYTDTGLTNGTTYYYVVSAVNSAGESANSNQVASVPTLLTTLYQIDSGGGAVGTFSADTYYSGGDYGSFSQTINTTGVANAAPMAVYQSVRFGNFNYTLPNLNANSTYTVRLHFAESYFTSAGKRVFNVAINGTTVLSNFDVFATVGANKALVRDFSTVTDSTGRIVITFTSLVDNALVNGVEILTGGSGGNPTLPSAPTGLTATAGNAQVTLAWTAVSGATSYKVYRSTTSGSGYALVGTSSATSIVDTGLTNGTTYYYVVTAANTAGESAVSNQASATPTNPNSTSVYRINSGGGATGSFSADNYYSAGDYGSFNQTIDTTGVANAAPAAVYQSVRFGNFNYSLPNLTAGATYTVRLHFAESYFTSAGKRIFNVTINGATVLSNFDVFATVGANKALVKDFTATADGTGKIVITFTSLVDNALVNGVEILTSGGGGGGSAPSAPTNLIATAGNAQVSLSWSAVTGATSYKVYRSTTSGSGYAVIGTPTSNSGVDTGLTNGTTYYYVVTAVNAAGESAVSNQVSATPTAPSGSSVVYQIDAGGGAVGTFSADRYYSGGDYGSFNQTIDTTGVANAAPAAVYQSVRFGNFNYSLPNLTAGATYTVRLHFAESYFTSAGKRIFNVTINGATVLSNFDVFATVGANKALVRDFTATADGTGKIVITFTSLVDNALVNGVEILH